MDAADQEAQAAALIRSWLRQDSSYGARPKFEVNARGDAWDVIVIPPAHTGLRSRRVLGPYPDREAALTFAARTVAHGCVVHRRPV